MHYSISMGDGAEPSVGQGPKRSTSFEMETDRLEILLRCVHVA